MNNLNPLNIAVIVILIFIITYTGEKKEQMEPTKPEHIIETRAPGLPESCHTEDFTRFARLQMITICMNDDIPLYISTTTPPEDWMLKRYPQIVDSLKRYHIK